MPHLFGEKLRFVRQQQHLTQKMLATRLGFASHTQISNLESGYRPPTIALVELLSHHFSVSLDYWLRDDIPIAITSTYRAEPLLSEPLAARFGRTLRTLRQERRLNQTALAQQLSNTTQAHISLLEAGLREPSVALVLELMDLWSVWAEVLLS